MLLTYLVLVFYLKTNVIWIKLNFHKIFSVLSCFTTTYVLIRYLISSQSFVYFSNIYVFLSVEAKTKYLFSLLSSMYLSDLPIVKYRDLLYECFHNPQCFWLWCIRYNKYQCFCMTFCLFLASLNQNFWYWSCN